MAMRLLPTLAFSDPHVDPTGPDEVGFRWTGARQSGHGEELRRTRGEAAGEKLGTNRVNRLRGERGNRRVDAPPTAQVGEGQERLL
jgi:hypothetical protein